MSDGVGLVVMAAIFAFGVVLFAVVAITLLPASTWLFDRIDRIRRRRSPSALESES